MKEKLIKVKIKQIIVIIEKVNIRREVNLKIHIMKRKTIQIINIKTMNNQDMREIKEMETEIIIETSIEIITVLLIVTITETKVVTMTETGTIETIKIDNSLTRTEIDLISNDLRIKVLERNFITEEILKDHTENNDIYFFINLIE